MRTPDGAAHRSSAAAIMASVYLVTVGEKDGADLSMDDERNVGICIAMLGAVFSAFPRVFGVV